MKSVLKAFIASLLLIGVLGGNLTLHAQASKTLTIFAASSLTDAFNELATAFKASNPDVDVQFSFGSSSTLATQLQEGAPADIFASANSKQMQVAVDAKRIAGKPSTFAKNRLILIVPVENPAKITGLKDLANAGVKLVIAADKVPVRDYTNTMLDRLVKLPAYGQAYKDAVLKNVVSEEANVRQVSLKVSLGEADAGIVYRSDVTPDIADKVVAFPIPDALNTLATYPIAVTNDSANADLAKTFIDLVLSDAGQDILVKWNFISVRIPELPATISLPTDGKLHLDGQVLNPLALSVDDLKANYAPQTVSVEYLNGENPVKANYTGVLLRDLLDSAQVNLNADVKNDKLSTFIVATGADGYQAVIAWGEIDADFGNQAILVAYESDGKPLAEAEGAFRLVVPTDGHGGRYVSQLVSLEVRDAPHVAK
ncbi:MAG: molybdate ABC transporter substrate-binding protein [Anaerolineae bacterium]|nr:molybdate ABC transporter substrate-binding protein [Anaerolineae bacterium]